eukprot:UN13265
MESQFKLDLDYSRSAEEIRNDFMDSLEHHTKQWSDAISMKGQKKTNWLTNAA